MSNNKFNSKCGVPQLVNRFKLKLRIFLKEVRNVSVLNVPIPEFITNTNKNLPFDRVHIIKVFRVSIIGRLLEIFLMQAYFESSSSSLLIDPSTKRQSLLSTISGIVSTIFHSRVIASST